MTQNVNPKTLQGGVLFDSFTIISSSVIESLSTNLGSGVAVS